jgi:hypothetical protein
MDQDSFRNAQGEFFIDHQQGYYIAAGIQIGIGWVFLVTSCIITEIPNVTGGGPSSDLCKFYGRWRTKDSACTLKGKVNRLTLPGKSKTKNQQYGQRFFHK